jgi:hypothetical protein
MNFLHSLLLLIGISITTGVGAEEPKVVTDAVASADWIAKALTGSGYKADFSLDSLKEIDRFFEEQAPNGAPRKNGLLATGLGSKLFALGGYVGEVIRRKSGGTWKGQDADPEAEFNIVLELKNGKVIWPVQRVMKRYRNGSDDGIYVYGFAITRS